VACQRQAGGLRLQTLLHATFAGLGFEGDSGFFFSPQRLHGRGQEGTRSSPQKPVPRHRSLADAARDRCLKGFSRSEDFFRHRLIRRCRRARRTTISRATMIQGSTASHHGRDPYTPRRGPAAEQSVLKAIDSRLQPIYGSGHGRWWREGISEDFRGVRLFGKGDHHASSTGRGNNFGPSRFSCSTGLRAGNAGGLRPEPKAQPGPTIRAAEERRQPRGGPLLPQFFRRSRRRRG